MKPIWVLLLATTPLGALTTWSFVELRQARPSETVRSFDNELETLDLAQSATSRARSERSLAARLTSADLLVPERIAELQAAPKTSLVQPLAAPWTQWIGLRGAVDDYLQAEQLARDGALPELTRAVASFEQIRQRVETLAPRSESQFVGLLAGRIGTLKTEITRRETESAADLLQAKIEAAFKAKDFPLALRLADDWLDRFTAPQLQSRQKAVRRLRARIEFHQACVSTQNAHNAAATYVEKARVLQAFVDKYGGTDLEPAELRTIQKCKTTIADLQYYVQQQKLLGEFQAALAETLESSDSEIEARLRAVEKLLKTYRGRLERYAILETGLQSIRVAAAGWLAEALPEKTFDEPAGLEEAVTKSGQLVRGFFKAVTLPDGAAGYKCFPTAAQRANPTGNVGAYRADDLLGRPTSSIPRQALTKYNEARARLLAAPGQKPAWDDLARCCNVEQRRLTEYEAKRKAVSGLSFTAEGELAARIPSSSLWQVVEQLWTP